MEVLIYFEHRTECKIEKKKLLVEIEKQLMKRIERKKEYVTTKDEMTAWAVNYLFLSLYATVICSGYRYLIIRFFLFCSFQQRHIFQNLEMHYISCSRRGCISKFRDM